MGILRDAWNEAWETAKATFWEATCDAPIVGPIIGIITHTEALAYEWEEIRVKKSRLGVGRGREIGMLKANRPDIKIVGISDEGFYVETGMADEAEAYLRSVGLL